MGNEQEKGEVRRNPKTQVQKTNLGTLRVVLSCKRAKAGSCDQRESERSGIRHPDHPPIVGIGKQKLETGTVKSERRKEGERGHRGFSWKERIKRFLFRFGSSTESCGHCTRQLNQGVD